MELSNQELSNMFSSLVRLQIMDVCKCIINNCGEVTNILKCVIDWFEPRGVVLSMVNWWIPITISNDNIYYIINHSNINSELKCYLNRLTFKLLCKKISKRKFFYITNKTFKYLTVENLNSIFKMYSSSVKLLIRWYVFDGYEKICPKKYPDLYKSVVFFYDLYTDIDTESDDYYESHVEEFENASCSMYDDFIRAHMEFRQRLDEEIIPNVESQETFTCSDPNTNYHSDYDSDSDYDYNPDTTYSSDYITEIMYNSKFLNPPHVSNHRHTTGKRLDIIHVLKYHKGLYKLNIPVENRPLRNDMQLCLTKNDGSSMASYVNDCIIMILSGSSVIIPNHKYNNVNNFIKGTDYEITKIQALTNTNEVIDLCIFNIVKPIDNVDYDDLFSFLNVIPCKSARK